MSNTFQDYTVTDAADKDFLFVKNYLDLDHVRVFRAASATQFGFVEVTSDFTTSGVEGNLTVTLTGGTAVALAVADVIRVKRITPSTALVTFSAPSLNAADLNLAVKQLLYLADEAKEFPAVDVVIDPGQGGAVMQLNTAQTAWEAGSLRITNVGPAIAAGDALNLGAAAALLGTVTAGAMPIPVADNVMLYGLSSVWTQGDPSVIRSVLGLGSAAVAETGVATGVAVPTRDDADARYLTEVNNLSDLVSAGTARTNLGLGGAAVLEVGTAALEIIQLDASAKLPAVDGSQLDLSDNTALVGNTGIYVTTSVGANVSTGATQAFSYGNNPTRVKLGTAGGDQTSYNGGATVNAATGGPDNNSLELTSGATAVHEVEVSVPFNLKNNTSVVDNMTATVRTTTDLTGATGWTTLRSSGRAYDLTSVAEKSGIFHTKVVVTGDRLVAVELAVGNVATVLTPRLGFFSTRRLHN